MIEYERERKRVVIIESPGTDTFLLSLVFPSFIHISYYLYIEKKESSTIVVVVVVPTWYLVLLQWGRADRIKEGSRENILKDHMKKEMRRRRRRRKSLWMTECIQSQCYST
jgi:hypothetical protein